MYFELSDKIESGNFEDALKDIFKLIREEIDPGEAFIKRPVEE